MDGRQGLGLRFSGFPPGTPGTFIFSNHKEARAGVLGFMV